MIDIYRASAGSGKTHQLTKFYLRLLFDASLSKGTDQRALFFNEILAVTFTNKATTEMKERIIQELHQLGKQPDQSDFYGDLAKAFPDIHDKQQLDHRLQSRAQSILRSLLYDYSEFHVSTIDSFFQQVLRSFTHELSMQGNAQIELDSDAVHERAVSDFITSLDIHQDAEVIQWLISFSNSLSEEGKSWNLHKELVSLASLLQSEQYKQNEAALQAFTADRQQLTKFTQRLREIKRHTERELSDIGNEADRILSSHHLKTSDFPGKGRSAVSHFYTWQKGTVAPPTSATAQALSQSIDNWIPKEKNSVVRQLHSSDPSVVQQLKDLWDKAAEVQSDRNLRLYYTVSALYDNIFQVGLLGCLQQYIRKYCTDNGVQLLANTTEVLNRLIGDDDAPFIYEKTGTQLQSFMIDEFQDTSGMQWSNFRPLIANALSMGNSNLIVGDVKQSIYRWRGSNWNLLASELQSFYPGMQNQDPDTNYTLIENWRSGETIIHFNNTFFPDAATRLASLLCPDCQTEQSTRAFLAQQILSIYGDVCQDVPKKRKENYLKKHGKELPKGMVCVKRVASDDLDTLLPRTILLMQEEKGFSPSDFLILGRTGAECSRFAQILLHFSEAHPQQAARLNVLTDEALLIANRPAVRALVAMLRYLSSMTDQRLFASALVLYHHACGKTLDEAVRAYLDYQLEHPADEAESLFGQLAFWANAPLYETIEHLITMLPTDVRSQEAVFLEAFRDNVLDYIARNGADLISLLSWWTEKGSTLSISMPASQDAIQIMTIHKSKGLGKPVVIIPKCDWDLDLNTSHKSTIWVHVPSELSQGTELPMLPIRINNNLSDSLLADDYDLERQRAIIDNLNTAYVAFTRAKDALIIFTPEPAKSSTAQKIERYLSPTDDEFSSSLDKTYDFENIPDPQEAITPTFAPQAAQAAPEAFNPVVARLMLKPSSFMPETEAIANGNAIHEALAAIRSISDLDDVRRDAGQVDARLHRNVISQRFLSGQSLIEPASSFHSLSELLQAVVALFEATPSVSAVAGAVSSETLQLAAPAVWFDPANQAYCEKTIITQHVHTHRPDRMVIRPDGTVIVIDYKTGDQHLKAHTHQVSRYCGLLRDMGFTRVFGYLWYFQQQAIVPVQ